MQPSQIISLDVGMSKTGIARASSIARLPEPLKTVPTDQVFNEVEQLNNEQPLELIVVGLPRNLNSEDTDQTKWVRQWVSNAKQRLKLPFYFQDEALTSKTAVSNSKQKIDEDAQAAAIILQDFLDTPEEQRVSC